TIDQVRLYGGHAKWFADLAPAEGTDEIVRYFRAVACRAIALTRERPAGPVHLNVPLREPLMPAPRPQGMLPGELRSPSPWGGRAAGMGTTLHRGPSSAADAGPRSDPAACGRSVPGSQGSDRLRAAG